MCGIAGVVAAGNRSCKPEDIQRAVRALRHRGPDDEGFLFFCPPERIILLTEGKESSSGTTITDTPLSSKQFESRDLEQAIVALGHRRLSIIDRSPSGHQPMRTPDGKLFVVLNGEIYNHIELRSELEALGHHFGSRSDTEVLLAAYNQWGVQALGRLVGMFAFAILDLKAHCLLLARDFFGMKPMYYTRRGGELAFASEISALLELTGSRCQVNPNRLYDYLQSGITDHGEETLFAGIQQLPAAHYLEIPLDRPGDVVPVRYWQVDLDQRLELSFEDAAERLRELFLDCVRLHLRSDVPVGTALSGGIDSSAIVMAVRKLQGPNLELHTFSYIADETSLNEERWIDIVGRAAGAVVHRLQLNPQELVADFDRLIQVQDEPFGSACIYAQYRIFQLAQQAGIQVILNGQGGDELFAGYLPYLAAHLASMIRKGQWVRASQFVRQVSRLPQARELRLVRRALGFLLPKSFQSRARQPIGRNTVSPWLNAAWFAKRGVAPNSFAQVGGQAALKELRRHNLVQNNLPALLRHEDRNSMAFSIESRLPFLTPSLVNFAFSLPDEHLIAGNGTGKAVFRHAMRGIVPEPVLDRRDKIGFAMPIGRWLFALRPWVDGLLREAVQIPALNPTAVEQEWETVRTGRNRSEGSAFLVWRWVSLIGWARRFGVRFE